MNRRDFIKVGSASVILSPSILKAEFTNENENEDSLFADCPNFINLYKKMDFTDGKEPCFPMFESYGELIFKESTSYELSDKNTLYVKPFNVIGRNIYDVQSKINRYAAETFITAAVDRNMVVYDDLDDKNVVTPRLYNIIYKTMRSNSGGTSKSLFAKNPITDIFIRASKYTRRKKLLSDGNKFVGSYMNTNVVWHQIPDSTWDYIEDYYINKSGGSYFTNDKNIILAITTENMFGDFVYPVMSKINRRNDGKIEQKIGMGILNNTRVLIGSF